MKQERRGKRRKFISKMECISRDPKRLGKTIDDGRDVAILNDLRMEW